MAKSRSAKSSKTKLNKPAIENRLPDSEMPITGEAEQSSSEMAIRFVGQWNRLISTTNWEKGRIICEWREALMTDGVPVMQYSDEAWAQLVGNVTSQHVGRLRRVSQRFGEVFDQYEGLYWSHFQAALDWDDAEMWLEGAIQNEWSVSQMRGKRWETLGTPVDQQAKEVNEEASDAETLDEDAIVEDSVIVEESMIEQRDTSTNSLSQNQKSPSPDPSQGRGPGRGIEQTSEAESSLSNAQPTDAADTESEPSVQSTSRKRQRLDVELDDLPDDIAEAFEQFKLAIIAQRHEGWKEISPDGVIECLDALKQLVGAS